MIAAVFTFLVWLVPPGDVDALRRTAPEPITHELAAENLAAARVAGAVYELDADLVLSIAAHESHYESDAVTSERDGKVSCGVMTPEPIARCSKQTALGGYLAGAKHLRGWIDGPESNCHGNLYCALLGYAGGYDLISACATGPVFRKTGHHDDLCLTPRVFLWRRNWIRNERTRPPAV
jgi:hypothetical protein